MGSDTKSRETASELNPNARPQPLLGNRWSVENQIESEELWWEWKETTDGASLVGQGLISSLLSRLIFLSNEIKEIIEMHGMHPFTVIKIKVSSPTTATTIMNSSMLCLLGTGNILDVFHSCSKVF